MTVRIRDTLLRDTVELVPREPGKVSIYVCGPTVYDVAHVGHGRTHLVFDVIRRYLEWSGLDVTYVSNITDVEDKIIARAAERGTTEPELAQTYERAWFDAMEGLGVRRPDHVPHATEYIDGMLDSIHPSVPVFGPNSEEIQVGGLPGGGQPFIGMLDEVAIWTRALTPAEIQSVYEAGIGP